MSRSPLGSQFHRFHATGQRFEDVVVEGVEFIGHDTQRAEGAFGLFYRQDFSQCFLRASEQGLYRSQRHAEVVGNLGVTVTAVKSQFDGVPLRGGQALQRGIDDIALLMILGMRLRAGIRGVFMFVRLRHQPSLMHMTLTQGIDGARAAQQ